jgi:hypothetical protein
MSAAKHTQQVIWAGRIATYPLHYISGALQTTASPCCAGQLNLAKPHPMAAPLTCASVYAAPIACNLRRGSGRVLAAPTCSTAQRRRQAVAAAAQRREQPLQLATQLGAAGVALPAGAEEAAEQAAAAFGGADAAAAAQAAASSEPTDLVFSALFTIASKPACAYLAHQLPLHALHLS